MAGMGRADSILVSKLPTNMLLGDLKSLLLGHFANFGRIVRISCAMKGRERVGHLQFSTADGADKACKGGKVMNGHPVVIALTQKVPPTMALAVAPQPMRSTLTSASASNSNISTNTSKESKPEQKTLQASLETYFNKNSGVKNEKKESKPKIGIPSQSDILNEAMGVASSSSSTSPAAQGHGTLPGTVTTAKLPADVDCQIKTNFSKNTCVDLQVYTGPSSSNAYNTNQTVPAAEPLATTTSTAAVPSKIKREQSLSEILNLDYSKLKVIKTVSASDVLALQYFTPAPPKFSLSLMFADRIPGNVVMPLKSLMDSIKPGMKINDSTVDTVWNTISRSVVKTEVQKSAKIEWRTAIVDEMAINVYDQLESNFTEEVAFESAERETEYEVDTLIICEEVVDALLYVVCETEIETSVQKEYQMEQSLTKTLNCCYRKLCDLIIKEIVEQAEPNARLDVLCEEVIDDILESPIFTLHLKVVAGEALKECQVERDLSEEDSSDSSSSGGTEAVARRAISDALPAVDWRDRTKEWLLSHVYNVDEPPEVSEVESESSIGTNMSCSVSVISNLITAPVGQAQCENSDKKYSVSTEVTCTDRPIQKSSGFFGSLKRKAESFYVYLDSKKPKFMRRSDGRN